MPAVGLSCERECKHPPGVAETDPTSHLSRLTVRPCDLGRSPSQFDRDDQLLEVCQSKVMLRVSWFKVIVYCLRVCARVSCVRVSLIMLCYYFCDSLGVRYLRAS